MVKILRAAAYGRVSTNSRAQAHSFENQSDYWNRKLTADPNYQYVGLFADKGISGKNLRLRPQMLALLDACRRREVDIIFTKSVQRFARNTMELLETIRELRELGIAVVFEKENINTLTPDSELYLTIAAAVAEEDLNRYGDNVAWTIKNHFEKGDMSVIGIRMFGYETVNKQFRIVPHEARIVQVMFELYATGNYSMWKIAKYLNANGLRTLKGSIWRSQQVLATLQNEKYKGEALLYKWYNSNENKKKNKVDRDMFLVENNHPAIVSVELWDKVQAIINSRANHKLRGKELPTYEFTGKIECPICGKSYMHKINNAGTKYACPIWKCYTHLHFGKAECANTGIKDSVLKEKFVEAYNEFVETRHYGGEELQMQEQLDRINREEKELITLHVRGLITKADFEHDRKEIVAQRKAWEKKMQEYRSAYFKKGDLKTIEECDEELVSRVVRKVTILNWVVTFEFYNGVKISRSYTNGRGGNQKGWLEKKKRKEMEEEHGKCS